jgi:hypothetical protein
MPTGVYVHKPVHKNISGQVFGCLTALHFAGKDSNHHSLWICRCECGNVTPPIALSNLTKGHTRSCGCYQRERACDANTIHGHNNRRKESPTYISWRCMIARCTNPNQNRFYKYGGAGVEVCDRWLKFDNFLADMGERPEGTTLSRFGDVGNYEPGNCAWHTWPQQGLERQKKFAVAA